MVIVQKLLNYFYMIFFSKKETLVIFFINHHFTLLLETSKHSNYCFCCQLGTLSSSVTQIFYTKISCQLLFYCQCQTMETNSCQIAQRRVLVSIGNNHSLQGYITATVLCGLSLSYKHNCYQCFFLNLSSFSPTSLIATFTSISAGQIIHMCQEPSIQRILHQDSSWEQVKA